MKKDKNKSDKSEDREKKLSEFRKEIHRKINSAFPPIGEPLLIDDGVQKWVNSTAWTKKYD